MPCTCPQSAVLLYDRQLKDWLCNGYQSVAALRYHWAEGGLSKKLGLGLGTESVLPRSAGRLQLQHYSRLLVRLLWLQCMLYLGSKAGNSHGHYE